MKQYAYVIIGGGQGGDAAVRGIRDLDKKGSIAMICLEPDPPYVRPKLSKDLWKGKPLETIWCSTESLGVEFFLGRKASAINTQDRTITDDRGDLYRYDKVLLATGGTPNRLAFGGDKVIYYRGLQDYRRLRALSRTGRTFLVIGGGFIGSEIAAALSMAGKSVAMVFPDKGIGWSVYPEGLSRFLTDYYRQKGVEVFTEERVVSLEQAGGKLSVHTQAGRVFEVDGVVAGIGIHPDTELAQQAGLAIDNGIVVDEHLQTSTAGIYAAGDVAAFLHAALAKRVRVEHEDNAVQMGRMAGRNMAGSHESYTHAPMFYSDLFDLGYEAVGELSSKLETIADWKDPYTKGVVYYMKDGRVRGVLLWNVWDKVSAARALLGEQGPFTAVDLIGRL
ncbi:MAG: FAD-dependent oxidoreductase [Sphaerochaeta sp.]|nr:FAD-dependent oxidoreductase [Sphaerochaeta sp.]